MNKFAMKLSVLALVGTIGSSFVIPSTNASAMSLDNSGFEMSNLENEYSKYQDFIHIVDGKYVIDDSLLNSTDKDVEKLKTQIDFTNSIIDKYNVKDVSLEEGFSIYVSNAEINKSLIDQGYDLPVYSQKAGVTKVQFYWWGFYLYLDSYWTGLAMTAGVGAIAGGIGAILGGGVGAGVAVGVAGAVADYVLANSSYAQRGCVVSWNYVLGLQSIWAQ